MAESIIIILNTVDPYTSKGTTQKTVMMTSLWQKIYLFRWLKYSCRRNVTRKSVCALSTAYSLQRCESKAMVGRRCSERSAILAPERCIPVSSQEFHVTRWWWHRGRGGEAFTGWLCTSTPPGSRPAASSSSSPATATRLSQSQRRPPTPRSSRPAWSRRRRPPSHTAVGTRESGKEKGLNYSFFYSKPLSIFY